MGIMMDSLMESFAADEKLAVAKALAEDVISSPVFKAMRLEDGRAVLLTKEQPSRLQVRFDHGGSDRSESIGFPDRKALDDRFDSLTRHDISEFIKGMTLGVQR